MNIVDYFDNVFWGVATSSVSLLIPILALFLVFRLVHDILWR